MLKLPLKDDISLFGRSLSIFLVGKWVEIVETPFSIPSSWTMFAIVAKSKCSKEEFVLIQLSSTFFLSRHSMKRACRILMTGALNCSPFGTDNAVFGVNWSSVLEPDEQKHGLKLMVNFSYPIPNYLCTD